MYFSKKLRGVKHCFFSRKNGSSEGIYRSLNCGPGSKDKKKNVKKNLDKISKFLNIKSKYLKLMHQEHSSRIIHINKNNVITKKFYSDALITKLNKIGIGVLTADCVPILLYDKPNQIIGCIHAGWKGAFKDIIKKTVIRIKKASTKKNNIAAAVGPCIGKKSYEVDFKFKIKFLKKFKKSSSCFNKTKGKYLFDLRKFVNLKLRESGIKRIDNIVLDTFKNHKSFFSYRRSKLRGEKDYGRCISVIKLN